MLKNPRAGCRGARRSSGLRTILRPERLRVPPFRGTVSQLHAPGALLSPAVVGFGGRNVDHSCDHNVPHAPLITPRATFIDDTRMGSDFCTTHEKQARQACTKARGPCTRALNSTLGALFGSPWVKTPPKCGCLAGGGQVAHDAASMTAREETQHALLGIMRTPPSKAQCGRGLLTRYL